MGYKIKTGYKVLHLDCTLRDGGMMLEDNSDTKTISNNGFLYVDRLELIKRLINSSIDIIELGILDSKKNFPEFSFYNGIEEVSDLIPIDADMNRLTFATLINGPDYPLDLIPQWRQGLCQLIRFVVMFSKLEESIEYCKRLSKKGYKISIQPALTSRYSESDFKKLIGLANEIEAFSFYVVDSFGYMQSEELLDYARLIDKNLNQNTAPGFHGHNNFNLAFSNSQVFVDFFKKKRHIIIDTCLMGMGLGSGNLQTELFYLSINKNLDKSKYFEILSACEIIDKYLTKNPWGYTVESVISAYLKSSFKYGIIMRNSLNFNYVDIYNMIENLPLKYKQTFYKDELRIMIQKVNRG